MYKVFFEDRFITLGERAEHPAGGEGLVYPFENRQALVELLEAFSSNEQISHMHLYHDDLEELRSAFDSFFRRINAGGGLVMDGDGAFLAIFRNGMWDLPKGKLEKGETFGEAALREVEEETGLHGISMDHLLSSTFHTYVLKGRWVLKETRWFRMHYAGNGQPVLQQEEGITDFRWIRPGEASFMVEQTYASIRELLETCKLI